MPEAKNDDEKKNTDPTASKDTSNLGLNDYQFFVHDFSSLDYQFTHPIEAPKQATSGASPSASGSPISVKTNIQGLGIKAGINAGINAGIDAGIDAGSYSVPETAKVETPAATIGGTEKQISDSFGAVITYPLWQILPEKVRYANGHQVSFEYDVNGDVTRILETPGNEWRRGAEGENKLYTWTRSDGKTFSLQAIVLPDGNYQMIHKSGNVFTYTTAGKLLVGKPFRAQFDLKQSLVRVFRQLQMNDDGLLSKKELNAGVSYAWANEDDAQLVTMLKTHFELIQLLREKALLKLGKGVSMDDILRYDSLMRSQSSPLPSAESMKTIEALFTLIDTDNDQNVSVSEIQERANQKKLTAGQRASLNYLITHTEKLHTFTARGYENRVDRMTKNEFIAHYKDVYRDQVGKYIDASGWGMEKEWRKTMEAKRTLYADPAQPLESLKFEAIKQGRVGDCLFLAALASLIAVRPEFILDCIKQNENETYTVTFSGAKDVPIAVQAPTSAELALYAKGSAYGIWAPLMEKAYGMLVAKRKNLPTVIPAENTATRENMKSLEILTGNTSRWEYTQDSFSLAMGDCKRSLSENQLRSLFNSCFRQKRAIIAAALKATDAENGEPLIIGMHAYSVVGWNLERDEVSVRNPWGIVPLNTSHMDLFRFDVGKKLEDDGSNGVFKLPLISFYDKFAALCVEQTVVEPKADTFR